MFVESNDSFEKNLSRLNNLINTYKTYDTLLYWVDLRFIFFTT